MAITIKDIAKLAGVSRGTVDRVLNNRGQVSPIIKEHILKLAHDYGYKKNVIASILAKKEIINIAIILPNEQSDIFWKAPKNGINKLERIITDYGFKLNYFHFDLNNSKSYTSAFQKAIKSRPNAILVAPVFLKESLSYLKIALHNNIPAVCINSEIDHEDVLSYIGQDSYQSGIIAARLFDLQKTNNNQIVVLTLGHDSKNAIHIQKKIDGLKMYNINNECKLEIHDYVIQNFKDKDILQSECDNLLNTHKNIKGIFFTNSRAYHFLNDTNILTQKKQDIKIIGYDLLEENIKLLKEGNIDFLLNQNPTKQGYYGIVNLFNYFIHNQHMPKKQYLPIDVVLKENYSRYIDEAVQFIEFTI